MDDEVRDEVRDADGHTAAGEVGPPRRGARAPVYLAAAGVGVVVDVSGPGLPQVVHWGADLGPLTPAELHSVVLARAGGVSPSALDVPSTTPLLPEATGGWAGTPGLVGQRDAASWTTSFRLVDVGEPFRGRCEVTARDDLAALELRSTVELTERGVLRVSHLLRNLSDEPRPFDLLALRVVLPLPADATELLDLTGRWIRERSPQRHALPMGTWRREGRHGRTGHDATLLLCAGTPGFGFRHGEVRALHVGWSGDHECYAERLPTGAAVIAGGELLAPGEIRLGPGESYRTPWVHAVWSGDGLDGVSRRLHRELRARPGHPASPRPVVLNTWEAVYFQQDLERLRAMADAAASIGVERFVLDDGWFRGRRDDTAGLGDWYVDEQRWPEGLHPLVDHVRGLGMQFGLWVEPEMVNPDSDLARSHPDWLLAAPGGLGPTWRHQHVLDLADPGASAHVLERLDSLLGEYDIAALKWDHNRDLVAASHGGRPAVHAQTAAVYRLLDELRQRHPGVEIESCASGGGRVDLGILDRTDRVWPSDTQDALERVGILRWTGLLLPPELMGAHVGGPVAHTTGRTQGLTFRCHTALFGHAGIEWDITGSEPWERDVLASWIRLYRRERELLHTGDVVNVDHPDPAAVVHGVVSVDRRRALFAYVQCATSVAAVPAPVRLAGLDSGETYLVEPVLDAGGSWGPQVVPPPWWTEGSIRLPGRVLEDVGLQLPTINPEQSVLLRLTAGG